MIEITFSENACIGLKIAQRYGEGKYSGGIPALILYYDGEEPTPEQLQAAQKEAAEKARLEWKNAVPMGGNTDDILGFDLLLNVGNISNNGFAENRQELIHGFYRTNPDMPRNSYPDILGTLNESLVTVLSRAANGEDIRIWYSNNPQEMCGLYWFMSELQPYEGKLGNIYMVKLPKYEHCDNDTLITHTGWGGIESGKWSSYVPLAETTTSAFRKHCADQWHNLQQENAPLRIVLNGQLVSAPETIYDFYIHSEIAKQEGEFSEGALSLAVMNNYSLGIGDDWIHLRIEQIIADGLLTIVNGTEDDSFPSSRVLCKVNKDNSACQ